MKNETRVVVVLAMYIHNASRTYYIRYVVGGRVAVGRYGARQSLDTHSSQVPLL
jgi:hypothetical protein